MLSSCRVLDLTDEKGFFAGRLLADFGADVIKVEPPGGDPARRLGPFYHNIPDPEKSLHWFFFNANKRGITLNIQSSQGQEVFKRLVKTADVVLESFPPGYLAELGLGYTELTHLKPDLILTSVSPFGQQGPYAQFKGSDLVCLGMSSIQYIFGEPERAPCYVTFPEAYLNTGSQAAAGTLIALYYREVSGEGQHVDISVQTAMANFHYNAQAVWDMNKVIMKRVGASRAATSAFVNQRQIWPCRDGYVAFLFFGGSYGRRLVEPLIKWMDEEGMAEVFLKEVNWDELDLATIDRQFFDRIQDNIAEFLLTHTKAELSEETYKRGGVLCPVQTIGDITQSPQLEARGFWQEVSHPELGASITYPGGIVKMSDWNPVIKRRAPLIGEHNLEIYEEEIGFSREELSVLKQNDVI